MTGITARQESIITQRAGPGTELIARVDADFRDFVGDEGFPCLAGKGTVHRGDYTLGVYSEFGSRESSRAMAADLLGFVRSVPADGAGLRTFAAAFTSSPPADEMDFEQLLWRTLQRLRDTDLGSRWDPSVSADPDDAHFSFSFGGHALFVVGLHPASSRLSRQFRWPALMFNPRAQFERLKREGRFDRMRELVRERDVALQGSVNPNLSDHGQASEARQYSGRATDDGWRCPFHSRATGDSAR